MPDATANNAANVSLYDETGQRVGVFENTLISTKANELITEQFDSLNNEYDVFGNLTRVEYFKQGVSVAVVSLDYDIFGNLTSVSKS